MNRPAAMRVAARLGRSRGRMRVLDGLFPPPAAPARPDFSDWESHELAAAWLGHATVLLRIGGPGGVTILTDPVLSTRVGLGFGLFTGGPKRLVAPPVSMKELPRLDAILISHAHFDHLDRPTLRRLPKDAAVVTTEHNGDLIRDLGFTRVEELRWNESAIVKGVAITARQVKHWGARTVTDRHRGFGGFLMESPGPRRRRALYGGDSAYHEHFVGLGKVDLAILGIGAYDPWIESHATPEEAWAMAQHVEADYVLPMHHSTFKLSHEPMNEPIERMLRIADKQAHRVIIRRVGEHWAA
jgi:L-ascorbate metabolism protein UlaG (beta-lactamase superfamily)